MHNKHFLFHLAPLANFPVGCVRAVPEEARPGARRVGLGAVGAGGGGLGSSIRAQSLRGGHHGAGDHTLLVPHTTAGRALRNTQIHTSTINKDRAKKYKIEVGVFVWSSVGMTYY